MSVSCIDGEWKLTNRITRTAWQGWHPRYADLALVSATALAYLGPAPDPARQVWGGPPMDPPLDPPKGWQSWEPGELLIPPTFAEADLHCAHRRTSRRHQVVDVGELLADGDRDKWAWVVPAGTTTTDVVASFSGCDVVASFSGCEWAPWLVHRSAGVVESEDEPGVVLAEMRPIPPRVGGDSRDMAEVIEAHLRATFADVLPHPRGRPPVARYVGSDTRPEEETA